MVNPVIPALIGLGGGAVIGYIVARAGGYEDIRPIISLSRYSVPIGQTYSMYLQRFPPNTQLVAPRNLAIPGSDMVNLGTTDANGHLQLDGLVAQGPAGTYAMIGWDAPSGKYCAVVTLIVT